MNMAEQRKAFFKIVRASLINTLGFGLAAFGLIYLYSLFSIPILFKILVLALSLLIIINVSGLVIFIYYTLRGMPQTMRESPEDISFAQIYGYTIAALILRCIEGSLCIYYLVRMFNAILFV